MLAMSTGLTIIGWCLLEETYWCFGVFITIVMSIIPMVLFLIFYKNMWLKGFLAFTGTMIASVYIIVDTRSLLERLGVD
jgi:hypothetical protein